MRGSSLVVHHFDVGRTTTRNHPIRWSARLTTERMSKCPLGAAVGHQCDGRRAGQIVQWALRLTTKEGTSQMAAETCEQHIETFVRAWRVCHPERRALRCLRAIGEEGVRGGAKKSVRMADSRVGYRGCE